MYDLIKNENINEQNDNIYNTNNNLIDLMQIDDHRNNYKNNNIYNNLESENDAKEKIYVTRMNDLEKKSQLEPKMKLKKKFDLIEIKKNIEKLHEGMLKTENINRVEKKKKSVTKKYQNSFVEHEN